MSIAKPRMYWPLTINSSNDGFKLSAISVLAIAHGVYYTPATLAAAITTALHVVSVDFNCTIDSDGILQVTYTGSFTLQCSSGLFTLKSYLGLGSVDKASVANAVSGDFQVSNAWYCPVAVREDSLPLRDRSMNTVTRAQSGQTKYITQDELMSRNLRFSFIPPERMYIAYESGANVNRALERLWQDGYARFRYWPDGSDNATYVDLVLDLDTIHHFAPARQFLKKALYELSIVCWGFVS